MLNEQFSLIAAEEHLKEGSLVKSFVLFASLSSV